MRAALGIFCATAAYQLYGFLGQPDGMPAVSALAAYYLLPAAIALWVVTDAHSRGWKISTISARSSSSSCRFMAPIYLFQTRGLRAFSIIGLFLAVFFATVVFATFMGYPASLQP